MCSDMCLSLTVERIVYTLCGSRNDVRLMYGVMCNDDNGNVASMTWTMEKYGELRIKTHISVVFLFKYGDIR